jgi:hypothetical protein
MRRNAEVFSKTSIRLFRSIWHLRLGGCQLGSGAHLSKNSSHHTHFVTHSRMGLKAIGFFGWDSQVSCDFPWRPTSRFFSALERRQLVIRSHNGTLSKCGLLGNNEKPWQRTPLSGTILNFHSPEFRFIHGLTACSVWPNYEARACQVLRVRLVSSLRVTSSWFHHGSIREQAIKIKNDCAKCWMHDCCACYSGEAGEQ